MSTDEGTTGATPEIQPATLPEVAPPKWFADYAERTDKRFEGLSAKVREAGPSVQVSEPAKEIETPPVSRADIDAAMELGGILRGLSDDAKADVTKIGADGGSYTEQLQAARLLAKHAAPANGAGPGANPPPGHAATPPTRTSPTHPRTQAEYIAIANQKADGDKAALLRWNALKDDPSFDPEKLELL